MVVEDEQISDRLVQQKGENPQRPNLNLMVAEDKTEADSKAFYKKQDFYFYFFFTYFNINETLLTFKLLLMEFPPSCPVLSPLNLTYYR